MSDETTITVSDLREHLADHIRRVMNGEAVVVTSHGQPAIRLVPYVPPQPSARAFGFMRGRIRMAADFDETPQDIRNKMSG